MYLTRRTYVGAKWDHRKVTGTIDIKHDGKSYNFQLKKIGTIIEDVAYWRKANAIHSWFVENCQGGVDECQETYIKKEQLEELLDICEQVVAGSELVDGCIENGYTIEKDEDSGEMVKIPNLQPGKVIKDSAVAEELLPTTGGFFFGSTEMNEWYLDDIKYTVKVLKEVIEETDWSEQDIYYQSSW